MARRHRVLAVLALSSLSGCSEGVLAPAGPIAAGERAIFINSLAIMLAIIVPVIVATFAFAWWFRAGNKRAAYRPGFVYSGQIELVVWSVPAMVILLLGGIAWIGSHDLDPPKPIKSAVPALDIDVVALDWKWLFVYRQAGVATVNRLIVPAGTPVHFRLTSATVMNSFLVPRLGGQIYAMAGMTTQLNLLADRPGRYPGLAAHYSGAGFADMKFTVDALPPPEFARWLAATRGRGAVLDQAGYAALAQRSKDVRPYSYGGVAPGLFDAVVAMRAPPPGHPIVHDGQVKG